MALSIDTEENGWNIANMEHIRILLLMADSFAKERKIIGFMDKYDRLCQRKNGFKTIQDWNQLVKDLNHTFNKYIQEERICQSLNDIESETESIKSNSDNNTKTLKLKEKEMDNFNDNDETYIP